MTRSGHEKRTPITMWRPGLSSAGAEDVHASIRSVGNGVVELEVAGSRLPIEVALSFLGPAVGQADVLGKLVCIVGGRILLALVGVLEVAKAGEIPPPPRSFSDVTPCLDSCQRCRPLRRSDFIEQFTPRHGSGRGHLADACREAFEVEDPHLIVCRRAAVEIARHESTSICCIDPLTRETALVVARQAADPHTRTDDSDG